MAKKREFDRWKLLEAPRVVSVRAGGKHSLDISEWNITRHHHFDGNGPKKWPYSRDVNDYMYSCLMQIDLLRPVNCRARALDKLPDAYERDAVEAWVRSCATKMPEENCRAEARAFPSEKVKKYISAIFLRIQNEPYNHYLHETVSCLLQSIAYSKRVEQPIPKMFDRIYGAGIGGVAASGEFRTPYSPLRDAISADLPAPFVVKAERPDVWNAVSSLNETCIGLFATNQLRQFIPNFMYVYGSYLAPAISMKKTKNNLPEREDIVAFGSGSESRYIMVETISNAQSYHSWMHANKKDYLGFQEILAQIVLSLAVARERCDFTHNDLHSGNILIRTLDAPVTLCYTMLSGQKIYLATRYIATIIDYGYAHACIPITLDEVTKIVAIKNRTPLNILMRARESEEGEYSYFMNIGIWIPSLGVTPVASNPLADIARFMASSFKLGKDAIEPWMRLLFGNRIPDQSEFEKWKDDASQVPPGITIDAREFFLVGLRAAVDLGYGLRVAVNTRPRDFPPVFNCERFPCSRDIAMENYSKPPSDKYARAVQAKMRAPK